MSRVSESPAHARANGVIHLDRCPSCGGERTEALLPGNLRFDSTLELLYRRGRIGELGEVDLSPFRVADYVLCVRCALAYARRRSTPESAARYYAHIFHIIETPLPYDTLPIPERFLERRTKLAADLLAVLAERGLLSPEKSAIHLRCNAGELLATLRDAYGLRRLFGMEYLPSLRRHATEVLGLDRIAPLAAPEFENPFSTERFDLVICNQTLAHAHDPVRVVRDLARIVEHDGWIVLYNEPDHARYLKSHKSYNHGINFFHKQLFTARSLDIFLREHGFETEFLPHPMTTTPGSARNAKLLLLLRPRPGVERRSLPSDEVESFRETFRRWWKGHRRHLRRRRLRELIRPRPVETARFGGGEARIR